MFTRALDIADVGELGGFSQCCWQNILCKTDGRVNTSWEEKREGRGKGEQTQHVMGTIVTQHEWVVV